jgi:hypothetical protein
LGEDDVSKLAGWYPQPDGREKYWDGELWSDSGPARKATSRAGIGDRPPAHTAAVSGWLALALTALAGALSSGFSGAAFMSGLFSLVVALVALARGRVRWARLGSRAAGGVALGASMILMTVGAVAAPPNDSGTTRSTSGSTAPTSDAAGAAARAQAQAEALQDAEAAATAEAAKVAEAAAAAAKAHPVATAVARAKTGTALAAASALAVKGRAPKTGYSRDQFGQAWFDTDRNGCDTRNDILRRDLVSRAMQNDCKVMAGTLAPDPYTGTSIRFIYGGASEVDIDHVVALSDAWQKGGATWAAGRRLALANDPLNLLAVGSSANRSKGDGDAATWLPPNKSYRCAYVARQVAVKGKYGIWVTAAEREAMTRVLATCPTMALPGRGSAATVAVLPGSQVQPAPAPVPRPAPVQPAPVQLPPAGSVSYANCTAVRAAGAAPIHRGDPGYAAKLDRDGDGIGCE